MPASVAFVCAEPSVNQRLTTTAPAGIVRTLLAGLHFCRLLKPLSRAKLSVDKRLTAVASAGVVSRLWDWVGRRRITLFLAGNFLA